MDEAGIKIEVLWGGEGLTGERRLLTMRMYMYIAIHTRYVAEVRVLKTPLLRLYLIYKHEHEGTCAPTKAISDL